MDEAPIIQYITDTFDDVQTATDRGNTFFFHGPDRKMPFATLVTKDDYDTASDLDRPGVFRLNIGVGKEIFRALFGAQPAESHDFTALDRIMPHPVYGAMFWVCVLTPSEATFRQTVQSLLAEAHALAVCRHAKREARE